MNSEENKAPFDITEYPKETYTNSKGEEKERYIVPDDVFNEYLKELPDNTINESGSFRAFHGGKLGIFGADPEKDLEIQKAGGEALQAALKQRRSIKEDTLILLAAKDERTGKMNQIEMIQAQIERAKIGDTKAFLAVRDTAGEKPAETVDLTANMMTEADRKLLEKALSHPD